VTVAAPPAVLFKEWAVVVDAMLEGRQALTLRKGGIVEENGRFVPDEPAFWLFPTYEHQSADVLVEAERGRYGRVLAAPRPPGAVEVRGFAACTETFVVGDESAARRLAAETIWTGEAVLDRFRMMPGRPLYAMVLRVRRLPAPVSIPLRDSYLGCKSWVALEDDAPRLPDPAGLPPVLADAAFEAVRARIRTAAS